MKILYIVWDQGVDYLADTTLIGLVRNGHDVTDTNYREYLGPISDADRKKYYGLAFSIGGTLPKERAGIDRSDIKRRIRSKEFDLVIYAHPFRCLDYLNVVKESYSKDEIIFLDGEDGQYVERFFVDSGIYFKREKVTSADGTLPISFSIPSEKIFVGDAVTKTRFMSYVTPLDKSTYIYENEDDYYNDYRTSIYGYTMPKGGWDCMRHYEIIANRCLPYFNMYDSKPVDTMTNWPTELQTEANYLFWHFSDEKYERAKRLSNEFADYALKNLTCEEVTRRMLNRL